MRVAVVGCGAMGAASAVRLWERGAGGAWSGPLVQEAFPMGRELEAASKQQLLTLTGLLMLGKPDAESVLASQAAAKDHGLEISLLDATELRRRYPGHIVADGEVAVFDPQAGFLRLEATMSALLAGPEVRANTLVTRVEPAKDGVEVATAGGAEKFDAAVIATGAWMREL